METVFGELAAGLAPVYGRRDVRASGLLYVRGLLMPLVAGNCWSIGRLWVWLGRTACTTCWSAPAGTRTRRGMRCAPS